MPPTDVAVAVVVVVVLIVLSQNFPGMSAKM